MTESLTPQDFLERRGVLLDELGLSEHALSRSDALEAVELVVSHGGTILGGDVYFEIGGRIETALANWGSDRREDESIEAYAKRSCAESRSYISRFPDPPEGQVLFVIVLGPGSHLRSS